MTTTDSENAPSDALGRRAAIWKPGDECRHPGIDIFRGLMAFGVIFINSGLVLDGNDSGFLVAGAARDYFWRNSLFAFAPPYFLLVSFYLAAAASWKSPQNLERSLKRRSQRLLLPYVIWTIIYFAARVAKYLLHGQAERITEMISDPVGLLCLGGTSVHLYFLPLLFTGLMTLDFIAPYVNKTPTPYLASTWLLALSAKIAMNLSGNGLNVETLHTFATALASVPPSVGNFFATRLAAVLLGFVVSCLPMVLMGFLAFRFLPKLTPQRSTPAFAAALVFMGIVSGFRWFLPGPWGFGVLDEDAFALAALLVAWALPIPKAHWITQLGKYSFGIFLMHQLLLQAVQLLVPRLAPLIPRIWVGSFLFIISVGVFAAAWAIVDAISRVSNRMPPSSVLRSCLHCLAGLGNAEKRPPSCPPSTPLKSST